jgi:hypothetical protein
MSADGAPRPGSGTPSLSAGYLAALPLFVAYELGQSAGAARAPAERIVARALALFEGRLQWLRVVLLLVLAVLALLHTRRERGTEQSGLPRRLAALVAEGVLAGFLLGPLLFGLHAWLSRETLAAAPPSPRSLAACLRLMGSAPWEELLFRVGVYGALFLAARRTSAFLGLQSHGAHFLAELAALLGSALLFAWFHLDSAQRLLGTSGEPYQGGLFLWRVSAGILLGALFRWRGFGLAAWAHAVFNLGIALGLET